MRFRFRRNHSRFLLFLSSNFYFLLIYYTVVERERELTARKVKHSFCQILNSERGAGAEQEESAEEGKRGAYVKTAFLNPLVSAARLLTKGETGEGATKGGGGTRTTRTTTTTPSRTAWGRALRRLKLIFESPL